MNFVWIWIWIRILYFPMRNMDPIPYKNYIDLHPRFTGASIFLERPNTHLGSKKQCFLQKKKTRVAIPMVISLILYCDKKIYYRIRMEL